MEQKHYKGENSCLIVLNSKDQIKSNRLKLNFFLNRDQLSPQKELANQIGTMYTGCEKFLTYVFTISQFCFNSFITAFRVVSFVTLFTLFSTFKNILRRSHKLKMVKKVHSIKKVKNLCVKSGKQDINVCNDFNICIGNNRKEIYQNKQ